MKKIVSFFRWAIVLFLATSILTVVAYRFIPVYITPLMVIRCFEKGELKMHHHWVPMDNISRHMPVAVMASEDQRFLLHHGFDYSAIEKAAVHNIKNKTGKKRGASTITQQTAKNVFLWPGRSWVRKGFEVYFTALIELIWSKQRIMEVYLNSIEMGDMIYGVDAVARYHFDKTASDLSRSECALIAATLPNPIRFSSKAPSGYVRLRQRKIEHEMKFIPSFPKEGEDIDPNTTKGGIYHKKR
ncbi:putative monofunctional biosynthetic peptidoglycan transglycosylase [Prevotella sp. BV3P1]|uniref:monofunctional biosynthetic peptidoglycan transglycosylase n=1 Tax=Prevotellaceae TaxID=171552 RepID=UPI0003B83035|nr:MULTISPECIES: monofunctional biosynthetic peptidoglycan transglycosylase [Prevotellaceae]ERT58097.1 putative monofunctional biosynthetic peptidoglycan transglycosylase [Prevotella sp. BV3P1]KGF40339.1 peptidoglycan transglycosylase [Hoylesella buccalis DNF00985]